MKIILLVQSAAVWLMVGITWALQMLNYPLLAEMNPKEVGRYQAAHNKRMGKTMIPGVFTAVITTVLLFLHRTEKMPLLFPIAAAVMLFFITGSAALHAAPAHRRLAKGFHQQEHKILVGSNWIRLTVWILFGVLDLYLLKTYA